MVCSDLPESTGVRLNQHPKKPLKKFCEGFARGYEYQKIFNTPARCRHAARHLQRQLQQRKHTEPDKRAGARWQDNESVRWQREASERWTPREQRVCRRGAGVYPAVARLPEGKRRRPNQTAAARTTNGEVRGGWTGQHLAGCTALRQGRRRGRAGGPASERAGERVHQ